MQQPAVETSDTTEVPDVVAQQRGSVDRSPQPITWRSRVAAHRTPGSRAWSPSTAEVEQARKAGVTLRFDDASYDLTFEVAAPDMALAGRAAMARWARLYERCDLPDWELAALSIERAGDTPIRSVPARPTRRRSRPRRAPHLDRWVVRPSGGRFDRVLHGEHRDRPRHGAADATVAGELR